MEEVHKPISFKCNIALSAPCKTDNLNCLLGWAEELQTVQKQYQEAELRITELENKYRAERRPLVGTTCGQIERSDTYSKNGNALWLVCRTFYR